MRYLLILILCSVQFQVQASDWLNRTVRVDLITHRQDFVRQYEQSDEMRIHSTDTNATNGQYPWTVLTTAWAMQVGFGVGTTCASTIISNNFALSNLRCAGQDLLFPVTSIEVYYGSVQWTDADLPSNFVRHFWYITSAPGDSPNIALFRLHEPLTFNPNIQPIRLSSDRNFTYEAWSSFTTGFRAPPGPFLANLVAIHASIFNNELCNFVGLPVPDHEICGIEGSDPSETGPIQRFNALSGGSWIVYEYTAGFEFIPVLVGIYQYQVANETASYGYATRVSHFVEWIDALTVNP